MAWNAIIDTTTSKALEKKVFIIKGDLFCDPRFIDPYWDDYDNFGDFSLMKDSPAKSSGRQVMSVIVDYFGNICDNDREPNRGAIQN